jgi:moderate conductance mechanosensitive channel
VEIAPLIAGAGAVGVAIGFGAETLVKDIIAGMFYLMDDASRVGEYIVSGSYKGTVESFSIRCIKLRNHRGYLYTAPFGALGAIQNMSRDWVIDKLSRYHLRQRRRRGEEDHEADRQGTLGGSKSRVELH